MKKISKENKEIERINKKLASMSLSREERNNYEFRLKAILDERSAISYATKKGKIEEKLEIAKKMLKRNMDIKEIQELTGLSKEEIENIN